MTASVINVLLTPRKAPARTTPTTRAARESVSTAIIARSRPNRLSAAMITGTVPKRRCSAGAVHTDVIASSTPQPKNTQPTCEALIASGNGVKASSVKKPML